jgi:hypothetical protein
MMGKKYSTSRFSGLVGSLGVGLSGGGKKKNMNEKRSKLSFFSCPFFSHHNFSSF